MSVALHAFTYDDLADTPDDGNRYEIINGELLVSPSPSAKHQRVLNRLNIRMSAFVDVHQLGEVFIAPLDVIVSPYNVVQPDLFFIARHRLVNMVGRAITGAPDLAVEVLSPHSRMIDLVRKRAMYATAGVQEYWAVDSRHRTVTVFTLVNGQYEVVEARGGFARSLVLPGFEINIAELFAGLADHEE
jgi:Uma2 family endonuclease